MKSLTLLAISLACSAAGADVSRVQEKFENVTKINLSSLQGTTRIIKAQDTRVSVEIQKRSFSDRCSLELHQSGETLDLEISKGWLLNSGVSCEADILIAVPESISLNVYQATGKVAVESLNNPLAINSPSANIQLFEVTSRDVMINATSGNVSMNYEQSSPGRIEIKTTSGSALYRSNNPTRISFESLSGRMSAQGKPVNTSANSEIKFSSISGSFAWK